GRREAKRAAARSPGRARAGERDRLPQGFRVRRAPSHRQDPRTRRLAPLLLLRRKEPDVLVLRRRALEGNPRRRRRNPVPVRYVPSVLGQRRRPVRLDLLSRHGRESGPSLLRREWTVGGPGGSEGDQVLGGAGIRGKGGLLACGLGSVTSSSTTSDSSSRHSSWRSSSTPTSSPTSSANPGSPFHSP